MKLSVLRSADAELTGFSRNRSEDGKMDGHPLLLVVHSVTNK